MNSIDDDTKNNIIQDLYDDLYLYLKSNPEIDVLIEAKDKDYYDKGLHCSRLGWCVRAEVLDYIGAEKKPHTLQTLLTFMRGNFYHELVYSWLQQSERFIARQIEQTVSEHLPEQYRGKYDVLIEDKSTGLIYLADIKTANSNQFKKYSNFLPKQDHIYQLSAYANTIEGFYDLLLMMYFSSGSDHPQFYFVDKYNDIENLMQEYINAVNEYDKTKILPDRISDKKQKWNCDYCDFNGISCHGFMEPKEDIKKEEFANFCKKVSD